MPATTTQASSIPELLRAYSFQLSIQDVVHGHFTAVSGLKISIKPIRYREGGLSQIVHHLPGRIDYEPVTLHYGLTTTAEMFDWLMTGVNGRVVRKHVSLIMLDTDGRTPKAQWDLMDAWVCEWNGAALDAMGSQVAVESMALAFQELRRVQAGG